MFHVTAKRIPHIVVFFIMFHVNAKRFHHIFVLFINSQMGLGPTRNANSKGL